MRTLNHFKTLLYYDGPELFIAVDQFSVSYLCLSIERTDESEKYICTPITKSRLSEFLAGDIDLLSLIKNPETGENFSGIVSQNDYENISITPIVEQNIPEEWLPEAGVFMKPEPVSNVNIIEESKARQRAVIHFSLNPPEAKDEAKISVNLLSQAIRLMQRVVTHAFRKSLHDLDEVNRDAINHPENYQLEIFAFSQGSFTVHMQTAAPVDMLGYSQISKAMNIIDEINKNIDDPVVAVQSVVSYGGHFAMAYRDLLQFIVDNKTPMYYEWSEPDKDYTVIRRISDTKAEPVYLELLKKSNALSEIKVIKGIVDKVDRKTGSWRLVPENEKRFYSGLSELKLDGIVIGSRYEFTCQEILEEDHGTGAEKTVFKLVKFLLLS